MGFNSGFKGLNNLTKCAAVWSGLLRF